MAYDSNTLAVYTLNNTLADATGQHGNLTAVGTPSFVTDKVNKGTYSYRVPNTSNYVRFPADIVTTLGTKSAWTISGWFCTTVLTDRNWVPFIEARRHDVPAGDRATAMIGLTGFQNRNYDEKFGVALGVGGQQRTSETQLTGTTNFQRFNLEWTGTQIKAYIDGVLIHTYNTTTNIFDGMSAANLPFVGIEGYYFTFLASARYDYYVVSDIARDGADVAPLPDVTSCTPDSGSTAGGTAVTIAGANFTGATGVTFGGDAATSVSVVSDISITCVTPAHAAGAVDVVVTTSAGSGTLTNGFTYINPAPTVTSITPTSGLIFGGTTTTITGTGFTNATAVTFGGLNAASYTVDSATTITAVTPAHAVGLVDVAITTAYGTATLSAGFEYRTPVLFKPTNDYIITVNNIDISQTQTAKFKESQELNIIENYDYALDGVEAEMPLEFAAQLRGADPVCVYNLKGEKRFKGYVSAKQFNYKSRKLGIKALPLTDYLNKSIAAFDESSASPAAHINNILNAYLPSEYKTGNIVSQSQKLQGISVSLDTDDAEINVKSIINSLCENYDIGLYNDGLNIRAYAVPNRFPRVGIDINNYLIELPLITEITD